MSLPSGAVVGFTARPDMVALISRRSEARQRHTAVGVGGTRGCTTRRAQSRQDPPLRKNDQPQVLERGVGHPVVL